MEANQVNETEAAETFFGNKDLDKKYPIPADWQGSVVVRAGHSVRLEVKDKDLVLQSKVEEVPGSISIKPYDASLFDAHVKSGMFGKENSKILSVPNGEFEKMIFEILHDPR